jgi:hypothetical protein
MKNADKPKNAAEWAFWDRCFAALLPGAIAAWIPTDPGDPAFRAERAGEWADAALAERRKRYPAP